MTTKTTTFEDLQTIFAATPLFTLSTPDNPTGLPVMVTGFGEHDDGFCVVIVARDGDPAWNHTNGWATLFTKDGKSITKAQWHLANGGTHTESVDADDTYTLTAR